jgi:hypothetical protein
MASNLPGDICLGEHSVCIIRGAKLDADCSVTGGADSGFVSAAIITATWTPVYSDERRIQPRNGCGTRLFSFVQPGCLESATLTGELGFHDPETKMVMFGGSLQIAAAGSDFAGAVGGYAAPTCDDPAPNGIYLEVIVQNAAQGVGDCSSADDPFPPYKGYIFGKTKLTEDAITFNDTEHNAAFTGTVEGNPNLVFGPWNDYPNTGVVANSPKVEVYYDQSQFEAIASAVACGYQTLPTPYS